MPGKWREGKVERNSSEMWREKECSTLRRNELFGDIGRLPQPKRPACERPGLFLHANLSTIGKTRVKGRSALRFPHLTDWMSGANGWGWRGRAQQHLGEGGKKLRKKRKQQLLSRPLAPAGEVAPPTPLPRGRPLPFTPLRTHYYAALDPSNCPRSPTTPPLPLTPGPIPTKFQGKLPPRARPVPDNRWAVAPAGLGLS